MPVTLATCKSKIRHPGRDYIEATVAKASFAAEMPWLHYSRVTLFHPKLISNMTLENPPFSIGNASSKWRIFHCHVSFPGGGYLSQYTVVCV